MKKYTKKPIEVEAIQFFEENLEDVFNFLGDFPHKYFASEKMILIYSLEGNLLAGQGDYIVKGIYDEFYLCKQDVFQKQYLEVK